MRPTTDQLPPEGVHQPVGASVQQQPELVGYEPMATEAIGFYVHLEVFDPVLALPAACVEFIKLLGSIAPCANDETPVGSLLHGFSLVDYPALFLPAGRPVEILTEEPSLLRRPLVLLAGFF